MSNLFVLDIETYSAENKDNIILRNHQNVHLASQQVHIDNKHSFEWVGLFNSRQHVKLYANRLLPNKQHTLSEDELIAQLGVFLGR